MTPDKSIPLPEDTVDDVRAPRMTARPPGSFFGRRKGPKLRSHQTDLLSDLLPRLALDATAPAPQNLTALFPVPVRALRIEIGFGGGEHLVQEALTHPDIGFIGCEPYVNGMAKALTLIEHHGVRNIRLFVGDAAELLTWLPDGALTRIDLIHPDPWPKRRHWKRRFVQPETVAEMARVLVPQGEFRFVCDDDSYSAWTLAHLTRAAEFFWTAERADDWRKAWPGYTLTRYGEKALRVGRTAVYFIFRRIPATPI